MAEPTLHVKPTQEELQARIDAVQKALEEERKPKDLPVDPDDPPEDDPNPPADGEGEEDEEIDDEEEAEDEEAEDEETPDDEEIETPKKPTEPKKEEEPTPPIDYKKRFRDSSREAFILRENKDKQDVELAEVESLPEPTEDELRTEYPDWDELSESIQKIAKKALHADKKEAKIQEIREKYRADEKKIGERSKEAEVFAIHPDTLNKFPKLEGRQEEFMAYASKPSRLIMDLEDLAKLFILDLPVPIEHKGKMFETGGAGGEKGRPKSNKLTLEQGAMLRETNYRKYVEYLKAGKIESAVE